MTEDDLDDWMRDAACHDAPVDEMFALLHREQRLAAAKWCTGCPVREPCLEDALADHAYGPYGVRGGLTQDDRRLMKRRTA